MPPEHGVVSSNLTGRAITPNKLFVPPQEVARCHWGLDPLLIAVKCP